MGEQQDLWIPLVDRPIGAIVSELEGELPATRAFAESPQKLLAFRTFAYIRVGLVLGRLLMESEVEAYDGTETWVESLLRNAAHREEIAAEVRAVADEIAGVGAEDALAPDEGARERFREFAKRELT